MLGKIGLRLATRRDRLPDAKLRVQAIANARRLPFPSQLPLVAVNLTAIGPDLVGGTSRYAVSLFEGMARLVAEGGVAARLEGIAQPAAAQHFSPRARSYLAPTPRLGNRYARVAYERVVLPHRLRRRRTAALVNPIFTGPTKGARRVATVIHDLYFRTIPQMVEPARRRYLEAMVPRMVRGSDVVVAISDHTAQSIRAAWPGRAERVVTVHSAARELPDAQPMAWRCPYILFVGVALPNKNVDCIVAAVADLRAKGCTVDLIHIGSDPDRLMAAAVSRYGAQDFVSTLPTADDATLASAYRGAVALVIASVAEGFCLPVLEAQNAGTPVCATRCGALPEVAGEAALYFDPDQADVLAQHVQTLLDCPERRAELADKGHTNAARFDWQRTAAAVFDHALGSGRQA
jgi:glycosyltransferase involved in cell wall biosynthesis